MVALDIEDQSEVTDRAIVVALAMPNDTTVEQSGFVLGITLDCGRVVLDCAVEVAFLGPAPRAIDEDNIGIDPLLPEQPRAGGDALVRLRMGLITQMEIVGQG